MINPNVFVGWYPNNLPLALASKTYCYKSKLGAYMTSMLSQIQWKTFHVNVLVKGLIRFSPKGIFSATISPFCPIYELGGTSSQCVYSSNIFLVLY